MSTNDKQGIKLKSVHIESENALSEITKQLSKMISNKKVQFACIGTDRSTGDSLGPLIGTMLEKIGYDVVGTLDNPMHGANLTERMEELLEDRTTIAIDACLGSVDNIGKINIGHGAITPGAGVNKVLPKVGDMYITAVVNVGGFMEYYVLQNTRLSIIMKMAELISQAIQQVVSLEDERFDEIFDEVMAIA